MNVFAGKSTTDRNKLIAAIVLGLIALIALYLAFGRGLFGGSKTVATSASPTPRPASSPISTKNDVAMPTQTEQDRTNATTMIVYSVHDYDAPDPGRNIFAFYEPPPTPPLLPTIETPKPPTPTPTPPVSISFVMPQMVYAGSGGFRFEVNGDKFTPETRIIFNQGEIPTTFVSPQKLTSNIPANFIASEGQRTVMVRTPDGKLYSNQVMLTVQAPPKPTFQYIGMIARKRYNNDTAYFMEQGKQMPTGARLNDVVGGRFRLVSISSAETVLEDVNLGFKHKVPLSRPAPGSTTGSSSAPGRGGFQNDGSFNPYNPNQANPNIQPGEIPGIPSNIPRYVPPTNQQRPQQPDKKDVDDDEDGDGDN